MLFRTVRFAVVSLAYMVALTVFGFFALLGPTLIFAAPALAWAMGGLITGAYRYFDDLEALKARKAATRRSRVLGHAKDHHKAKLQPAVAA